MKTTNSEGLASLHAESMRVYGDTLEAEQVKVYESANEMGGNFAEAHGMLNDLEARCGFDVTLARAALGSRVANWRATFPGLMTWETGGGCYAWRHELPDGKFALVTCADDCTAPTDSDERIAVGVYTSDGYADGLGDVEEVLADDFEQYFTALLTETRR